MTLETKIGGDEMVFWKKKKVDESNEGPGNPDRRLFMKKAAQTGIGAAAAYATMSLGLDALGKSDVNAETYKLPGAIAADPDKAVRVAWEAMHIGRDYVFGTMRGAEFARALLRLENEDMILNMPKVTEESMKTSHAFYLTAAKLNRCGSWLIDNYLQNNLGLKQYALGLQHLYSQRTSEAIKKFTYSTFIALSIGAKELGEGESKAIKFLKSDVKTQDNMLKIELAKFKNAKINKGDTRTDSAYSKLKDAYWGLGFVINCEYILGNKNDADKMRDDHDYAYRQIRKMIGANYNTANGELL